MDRPGPAVADSGWGSRLAKNFADLPIHWNAQRQACLVCSVWKFFGMV